MFIAQADSDRRFYGTILRGFDAEGVPVVFGKIMILDGFVCAQAGSQDVLGERLDELVKMVLDFGIHLDAEKSSIIAGVSYFLN